MKKLLHMYVQQPLQNQGTMCEVQYPANGRVSFLFTNTFYYFFERNGLNSTNNAPDVSFNSSLRVVGMHVLFDKSPKKKVEWYQLQHHGTNEYLHLAKHYGWMGVKPERAKYNTNTCDWLQYEQYKTNAIIIVTLRHTYSCNGRKQCEILS